MTRLVWDKVGERFYEAGLDQVVLYLPDGRGVAWSGVTGVNEKVEGNSTPRYFDGEKIYDQTAEEEYSADLSVLTYPDEFLPFDGVRSLGNGLYVDNQVPDRFGLAYRVSVGNDIEGLAYGYQLHLVYNLTAIPSATTYSAQGKDVDMTEFGWDISGIPEPILGYKATAHAIIDTGRVNKYLLKELYNILYGTDTVDARLPSLKELTQYVDDWALIVIYDNQDGTWTATGPDEYFNVSNHQFEITNVDATFFGDGHTYTVTTTTL